MNLSSGRPRRWRWQLGLLHVLGGRVQGNPGGAGAGGGTVSQGEGGAREEEKLGGGGEGVGDDEKWIRKRRVEGCGLF